MSNASKRCVRRELCPVGSEMPSSPATCIPGTAFSIRIIVVDPDRPVESTSSHRTEEHAPESVGLERASKRAALSWPGKRLTEEFRASMRRAGYNGVKSKLVSAPCVGATSPESVEAMMDPRASTTHKRIARRRLDTPSVARRDPPSLVALRSERSHGH